MLKKILLAIVIAWSAIDPTRANEPQQRDYLNSSIIVSKPASNKKINNENRTLPKIIIDVRKDPVNILRQRAEEKTKRVDILLQSAEEKTKSKDYLGALADYNQAVKIQSNSETYYRRAFFKDSILEDYQGALADYNKAIEIAKDNRLDNNYLCFSYSNRANIQLYVYKNYRKSLSDYNRAIAIFHQEIEYMKKDRPDDKFSMKVKFSFLALNYKDRSRVKSELEDSFGAAADMEISNYIINTTIPELMQGGD